MRLVRALESAQPREDLHLSALAEAQFARKMLHAGCTLEFETATPSGRHADFKVELGETRFYVHIKRLWVSDAGEMEEIPAVLRRLEEVAHPVTVNVSWDASAPAPELTRMAVEAREFALQASVGDEMVVRDRDGSWVGRLRVAAPHTGSHVVVMADDAGASEAAISRAQRLLRRAFGQFMPGAPNVVCVVGDGPASAAALETALLGTVVERWDRFPPKGHRVAHGRAPDGFWTAGQYEGCDVVVWLPISDAQVARIWRRFDSVADVAVDDVLQTALLRE